MGHMWRQYPCRIAGPSQQRGQSSASALVTSSPLLSQLGVEVRHRICRRLVTEAEAGEVGRIEAVVEQHLRRRKAMMISSSASSTSYATTQSTSLFSSPTSLNHAHNFISIKLTATNYLFWRTQLLPFLRGQNLHGFIDGSHPCPPSHVSVANATGDGSQTTTINPDYAVWIQQDQLILSLLISSLSEETLPIAVGLNISKAVWDVLEAALSSPSNSRILSLHMQLQNLKQDDLTVTQYLHTAKLISDELTVVGRPLCLADHNIYVCRGLRSEFKDIVTTLSARPQPVTFVELHSFLLNHEFINGSSLSNLSISMPQQPESIQHPSANLAHKNAQPDRSYNNNTNRGRGRPNRGRGGRGGRFNSRNYSTYNQPWQSTDQQQKCQICNGHNHTAPNFFQRCSQATNLEAYLSHSTPNAPSQQWFPDTGAMH
uniref:Retrotransposon Copia-like N-terminal domain-containing protein n=1 Tax=Nicotiana tabacum TaxID=4097 RepID=A0A1S4AI46_TOBAC|nr:PREDICTED: uncharacterized protein LOC107797702 [Nicotiana tabacum]